jgi:cell division septation protein DedD
MGGRKGGGDMVLGGRHLVGIFALLVVVLGVVFTLGYLLGRSQYDGRLGPPVEAAARRPDKDKPVLASKPASSEETPEPEKPESPAKDVAANHPSATDSAAQHPTDFDFYHSGEEIKAPAHLEPLPKPVTAKAKPKPAAAPELRPLVARANVPPVPPTAASAPLPAKATVVPAKKNASSGRPQPLNTPPIPNGATVLQVAALVREADALALAQALQQKKFPAFVLTPGADHFYRVQVGPYADAQAANAARHGLETQGFKSIVKR